MAETRQNDKREKQWYILIHSAIEGPYSIGDLKVHSKFTPDTLVWRKGLSNWVPAKQVRELRIVFQDERKDTNEQEKDQASKLKDVQEVLTATQHPGFFGWLLILLLLALLYSLYRLYS